MIGRGNNYLLFVLFLRFVSFRLAWGCWRYQMSAHGGVWDYYQLALTLGVLPKI